MANSRYNNFSKVRSNNADYYRLETFPSIRSDELAGITHSIVMWKESDRMDAMAESFFGDSRYWFVICLMNDLVNPFSYNLFPCNLLKIPNEVSTVVNMVQRKRAGK